MLHIGEEIKKTWFGVVLFGNFLSQLAFYIILGVLFTFWWNGHYGSAILHTLAELNLAANQ